VLLDSGGAGLGSYSGNLLFPDTKMELSVI
jgi:hypothetical protein